MFTGIIEEIGIVKAINKARSGVLLRVKTQDIHRDAKIGDSVAINGACLSVTEIDKDLFSFDVIQESLARTTLGELKVNDSVNLEGSLRMGSKLGGHFMTGHIDYKAKIVSMLKGSEGAGFRISAPEEFLKYIAEKGSIAIDGVSLTAAIVTKKDFTVYLIPHTLKVTTLGKKKKNDTVNIETDLLAKYISRQNQKSSLQDTLKKYEYI